MSALKHLLPLALLVASGPAAAQSINEIQIDSEGAEDQEFIEISGPACSTLGELTLIVIGDGAAGSGVLEEVIDLSGLVFDGNGLITVAEDPFTEATCEDEPDVTLCTDLNFENNDNVTYLLVTGLVAAKGDDLDLDDNGVLGIDTDNDMVEDTEPWAAIVDRLAVIESENPPTGGDDWSYAGDDPTVGPVDVMGSTRSPGQVFFCDGMWQGRSFDTAEPTPGQPNACTAPAPTTVDCTAADAGPMPGEPDAGANPGQPDAGVTIAPTDLTPRDQPGIICSVSGASVVGWLPLGFAIALIGFGAVRRRR